MKIGILGAGMSGVLAGLALDRLNIDFEMFDKTDTNVSSIKGLHYLHDDCKLGIFPEFVHNTIIGSSKIYPPKQYAKKVGVPLNNSLVDLPSYNKIYDFRAVYGSLKHRFKHKITRLEVTKHIVDQMLDWEFDYVISTIPLKILFPEAKCESISVGVKKGKPKDLPSITGLNEHLVVYNLREDAAWYRYSKVFDSEWTETLGERDFEIKKVITTDFTVPNSRIIPIGRWGAWDRKFLAHHSYEKIYRRFR